MSENLPRSAWVVTDLEIGERLRCVADRFASAVSDGRDGMTEQFAFGIVAHSDATFPGIGARGTQRAPQFSTPTAGELQVEKPFHLSRKTLAVAVPPDFLETRQAVRVDVLDADHLLQT